MKKILLVLSVLALSACAGKGQLERKTAFALGVDNVTVTDINKGLYEITWRAIDERGNRYNCSALGGNFASFGQAVSPSCVKVGSGGKGKKGFCNAMLKAAGKCK